MLIESLNKIMVELKLFAFFKKKKRGSRHALKVSSCEMENIFSYAYLSCIVMSFTGNRLNVSFINN